MEYHEEFERDFIKRTLLLMKTYSGSYDATLLINCLVGLLIVPREAFLNRIPQEPISSLSNWGISPSSIAAIGTQRYSGHKPNSLQGVVHSLRNSVAHFNITPEQAHGQVIAFRFRDCNGFDATIPISEMKEFVEKLANYLEKG